jgi:diadenylate cyclase
MDYLFNISDFFETVKWHDWLDIFIVAFLLYRCVVLFWKTLVFRAIIGITLLWFFDLIANSLGLIVTSLILKGIGAIIVIIVIVVFRNEIRGVISSTNPLNLFWGKPRRKRISDYQSIANTVFSLAEKRIGALLVFMRKTSLDHLVQDGVRIGAEFSRELIFSIFDNKSALHDGAVIMNGSQIQIAAAFLPLTTQQSIPLHYGTRHRAALGLSEQSDAVVIVVSEERGEVSLIEKGTVKLIADPKKLSSKLEDLIEGETRKQRESSRLWSVAKDIGVKGAFVIAAMFIWLFFAGEKESIISYTFPIEFRNLPKNLELLKMSADKAEVQISGSRHLLLQLKPERVGLSISLENSRSGENILPLTSKNLSISPGLNVVKISPNELTVIMEGRESKIVSIQPEWVGTLPEGKELLSFTILPDNVTVVGAPSILKGVSSITTEPIVLSALNESGVIEIGIILPTESVKFPSDFPKKVKVELEIGEKSKKSQMKKSKQKQKISLREIK